MIFFFFKQKTAYEMRISDWSSDVCSSDLEPHHQGRQLQPPALPAASGRPGAQQYRRSAAGADQDRAADRCAGRLQEIRPARRWLEDRKSVVEGKSVSVRVALGGRRIIKKKKQQTNCNQVLWKE